MRGVLIPVFSPIYFLDRLQVAVFFITLLLVSRDLVTINYFTCVYVLILAGNYLSSMQSASHRAAGASAVLRSAPQTCAAGRESSPGRWDSESAWLCQPSLASGTAGSSAASRPRKSYIRWISGDEGDGI